MLCKLFWRPGLAVVFLLEAVSMAAMGQDRPPSGGRLPETAAAPGSLAPLDPPIPLRGRDLDRTLVSVTEMARGMARAGGGYEAARLLRRLVELAPESDAGRSARKQLEDWGVADLALTDAAAREAGERIRRSLQADEDAAAAFGHARILMEIGHFPEAASAILAVLQSQPRGEARRSCEVFFGDLGLVGEGAPSLETLAGEREDEMARRLERGLDMMRFSDLERFLNQAEPEAGKVLGSLLRAAYPEHRLRRRDEGGQRGRGGPGGRFGFGGGPNPFGGGAPFFGGGGPGGGGPFGGGADFGPAGMVRRFNERLRAGGVGVGERFSPFEPPPAEVPPAAAAAPAPEPPADIDRTLEAAKLLASSDPSTARDLLRLALKVHGEAGAASGLKSLFLELEAVGAPAKNPADPAAAPAATPGKGKTGDGNGRRDAGEAREQDRAADLLFAESGVLAYRLELSAEAAKSLQTNPKTYVKATFSHSSEVFQDVGVRIKGSVGSFQPFDGRSKPAFAIKFNEFVKGQKFRGQSKIILGNAAQSPGYIADFMAFGMFRDAGLPAPRVTFATLEVGGANHGLYIQVEAAAGSFLKRWFDDDSGDLYEGPGDINRPEDLDLDSDPQTADRGRVRELADAAGAAAAGGPLEPLGALIGLDHLAKYLSLEAMIDNWDGYCGNCNNYRIYRDAKSGKFSLIPHGLDNVFGNSGSDIFQRSRVVLGQALFGSEAGRRLHREAVAEILRTVWDPARLRRLAGAVYHRIRAAAAAGPRRPQNMAAVEESIVQMMRFFEERRRMAAWQLRGEEDPDLKKRLAGLSRQGRGFFGGPGFGGPGGPPFPGGPR